MYFFDIDLDSVSRFGVAEIHRALRVIDNKEPIGRKTLAEELKLGEGSIRTILSFLRKKKFVSSTPKGHILSDKGKEKLEKIERKILKLDADELTVGDLDIAVIVKSSSKNVSNGVSIRDEAIKSGAKGATTMIFENNDFKFPRKDLKIEPEVKEKLKKYFRLEDGDVVIIGSGDNELQAERGALAGAEYLSKLVS